jgi:hypothetical protein
MKTPAQSIVVTISVMRQTELCEFVSFDKHAWVTKSNIRFERPRGFVRGGDPMTGAYMSVHFEDKAKLEAWAMECEELELNTPC